MKTTKTLKKIIHDITNNGGHVYFVGGCVRESLLHKVNKDVDIEIHDISVKKVEHILQKYGKLDCVGKSFGILKVSGINVDFAFPRKDNKIGDKHTSFESIVDPFMSLHEAAKRRDFTMNAIMQDSITGEYIDPFNGISDIKHKLIKLVDKTTFKEDSLRILRAAQFSARLDFKIDSEVIKIGKTLNYTHLSQQRIEEELRKGMMSEHPVKMMKALKKMNVLTQLSPELDKLDTVQQNPDWHPEGNVWIHSLEVIKTGVKLRDKASNPFAFMLTCLVHDIGKLETTKIVKNKITSYHHDSVGAEMVPNVLKNLIFSKTIIKYVQNLTKVHMQGHYLLDMKDFKLRELMYHQNINDILLFNICDNSKEDKSVREAIDSAQYQEKLTRCRGLEQGAVLNIVPEVLGRDLINLGLKPSIEFHEILEQALIWQMCGREKESILNTIKRQKGLE